MEVFSACVINILNRVTKVGNIGCIACYILIRGIKLGTIDPFRTVTIQCGSGNVSNLLTACTNSRRCDSRPVANSQTCIIQFGITCSSADRCGGKYRIICHLYNQITRLVINARTDICGRE